jgi:integrase
MDDTGMMPSRNESENESRTGPKTSLMGGCREFTPHCLHHWFTTILGRNGMPQEMVQELRGDTRSDPVDVYYHIDPEQMRIEHLRRMPRLGVR